MKNNVKSLLIEAVISIFIVGIIALPFLGFARNGDKIHVDKDASGMEDGSSSHPYRTISNGLDKARGGDEVIVAPGTYKERVTIPSNVKLSGSGKEKTFIRSDDKDDAVVEMKSGSKLWGFTVENGRMGIYVNKDAKVDIVGSRIRDNRHEGVFVEKGDQTDRKLVSISKVEIIGNGWSGIYSKTRKISITDSDIKDNGRNGVVFESGVHAWIDNNSISENKGSGLVMDLDSADVMVASKNTFRKNSREGIEVSSYGATGTINIKKSRLSENGHYGVARVSRTASASASIWSGLVIEGNNTFFGNGLGNTSPIVRGF